MPTSTVVQQILVGCQRFQIYTSFVVLIIGLLGNILNVVVFSCLKLFRGNQCVLYLIVGSMVDCGVLLIVFTSRIGVYAFQYDLTGTSLIWCKMKPMIFYTCAMISLTTVCFAAIDQYLSTSHHYHLRQISSLKLAQRLTCINIFVWVIHSILFGIFYEIQSSNCDTFNRIFSLYFSFVYLLFLNGLLPLIISSTFSALAYFNVRRIIRLQIPIVRRRLDRQLTAMVLIRIAFLFTVSVPYGLQLIYTLNTSSYVEDTVRMAIEQLILAITSSLFYFNYAGSFYLFLLSSTRFRRQVAYLFLKKSWRKLCCKTRVIGIAQHNQVAPVSNVSNID